MAIRAVVLCGMLILLPHGTVWAQYTYSSSLSRLSPMPPIGPTSINECKAVFRRYSEILDELYADTQRCQSRFAHPQYPGLIGDEASYKRCIRPLQERTHEMSQEREAVNARCLEKVRAHEASERQAQQRREERASRTRSTQERTRDTLRQHGDTLGSGASKFALERLNNPAAAAAGAAALDETHDRLRRTRRELDRALEEADEEFDLPED